MKPFFSIIIPCCDVEPYVRECFESVLNQSFKDWEIVAVVETSKDKTEEIVREYAAKDSRISVFTQPRSGSPAAQRNTALEHAAGEYVIFLDSDDTIAEGSLQRLHDKIAAHPGADLYPCAIQVENEITGRSEPVRDNYPADLHGELTGPEATRTSFSYRRDPCPMLQLTLCRRAFLDENKLRCVPGLRSEDSEFSPRALYLAKRVVPLHEPFYIYRIRANSIITAAKEPGGFLKDYAAISRSNLAFHARISQEPGFDRRISPLWAKKWLNWITFYWFSPRAIRTIPRKTRRETFSGIFKDEFADFNLLVRAATRPRKIAAVFQRMFVRHSWAGWLCDAFFLCIYYPLVGVRDGLPGAGR